MSFVSAKDLEAARQQRKEQKQLQREEIIREAKQNFEKEKKRQDLRKQRGEDLWLAPGVSERFERSPKAKKRKKQKKKDHRKGNGHKSRHEESSSSEESDQWVERCDGKSPVAEEAMESASTRTALQRDEWMQIPLAPSSLSMMKLGDKEKSEEARRKEKASLQCFEKPGQHPNELNPYWKDGGTGLPMERKEGEKKPSRIGDGGRSWIVRAYKRAVEQAKDEGRSLEEIACERWGSLENFYSILKSAGVDPKNPDLPAQSQRRRYLYSGRPRTSDIKSEDDGKEGQGRHTEQDPHQDGGWNKRDSRDRRGGRHETDKDREREEAWRSREFQSSSRCDRERDNYRDRRQFRDRDDRSRQSAGSKGFLKPAEDGDNEKSHHFAGVGGGAFGSKFYPPSSNWRKKGVKEKCEEEEVLESPRRSEEREERKVPSPVEEQSHASVPVEPVTDSQLNAIGAKILKAEMMGNEAKVKQLKAEMERLRSVKEMQASHPQTTDSSAETEHQRSREERTVVLTKTDRFGRTKPVDLPSKSYRPSPVSSTHSKKGKREKYFADDDRYSLKDLIEQERMATAEETHAMIARMASKFTPASSSGDGETVDDVMDTKTAFKNDPSREEERQRQRAMLESRKMTEVLANCRFCIDSSHFQKHLLVALGISMYLAVPYHQSLTEGHCVLVPVEHATCSMGLDENVWSEVKIFQKGLSRMFADRDMDVVFMETYTSVRNRGHMFIDCIPLPREEGSLAPMYFKKAILEGDEEWSQNKKLVDTRERGVRRSIPAGLPYFFVDFGLDGGFAHVIEDQSKFPAHFGREVVGGLLDAEPRLWLKPPRENFEMQKQKVLRLSEWWKPYDWTQKLKEKS